MSNFQLLNRYYIHSVAINRVPASPHLINFSCQKQD